MTQSYWFMLEEVNLGKTEIVQSESYPETFTDGTRWSSRSRGYDTKEALLKGEGILDKPCVCCGSLVSTNYVEDMKAQLIRKNMCFACNVWDERSRNIKKNNIIANYTWYTLGDEDGTGPFRGFGGNQFQFLKNDDVLITSTNVWYGGEIPPRWRDKIPNNAILIK